MKHLQKILQKKGVKVLIIILIGFFKWCLRKFRNITTLSKTGNQATNNNSGTVTQTS